MTPYFTFQREEDANVPVKQHPTDACADVYAYCPNGTVVIEPGERKLIRTGWKVDLSHPQVLTKCKYDQEVVWL